MKSTGAIILIFLGITFLLDNFNVFPFEIWNEIWKLWPLILIFLGVRAMTHGGDHAE